MRHFFVILIALTCFFSSCTTEEYKSGDGKYSYYSAEMALLSLADSKINKAELDDGRILVFDSSLNAEVLKKNFEQSVAGDYCRLMLYFNKGEETDGIVEATKILGANSVFLPEIALADTLKKEVKTDPLSMVSSWKAKNGKFYNFSFSVKTGTMDDAEPQSLGVVCDSISFVKPQSAIPSESDAPTVYLRLAHNQNNVPEFYSVDVFLSISKQQIDKLLSHYGVNANSSVRVKLSVNTYDGIKQIEL